MTAHVRPSIAWRWCAVLCCAVVWRGVVWCGVVWCGVEWCGVVWRGVVWCGVAWVWCGVACCYDDVDLAAKSRWMEGVGGIPPMHPPCFSVNALFRTHLCVCQSVCLSLSLSLKHTLTHSRCDAAVQNTECRCVYATVARRVRCGSVQSINQSVAGERNG